MKKTYGLIEVVHVKKNPIGIRKILDIQPFIWLRSSKHQLLVQVYLVPALTENI